MNRLSPLFSPLQLRQTKLELAHCNEMTARFGLILSASQIEHLALCRFEALKTTGRVEFGEGILKKLITAFCDAPDLQPFDYAETLEELQALFYCFKGACRECVTDDELIRAMRILYQHFGGSVDALSGVDSATLFRVARTGRLTQDLSPEAPGEEEDFHD